jgi:hypothetical protein
MAVDRTAGWVAETAASASAPLYTALLPHPQRERLPDTPQFLAGDFTSSLASIHAENH